LPSCLPPIFSDFSSADAALFRHAVYCVFAMRCRAHATFRHAAIATALLLAAIFFVSFAASSFRFSFSRFHISSD